MVALAYPDYFTVERRDRRGAWSGGGSSAWTNYGGFGAAYDPIWYGDLYPYYVTPLGSSYWSGRYNPYMWGGVTTPFVVVAADIDVDDPSTRAVMGRGYTRVRPTDVSGVGGGLSATSATGRRAKRRGSSGGSSASSGGGSGGAAAAAPSGYSRGGSTSTRTAQPRSPK